MMILGQSVGMFKNFFGRGSPSASASQNPNLAELPGATTLASNPIPQHISGLSIHDIKSLHLMEKGTQMPGAQLHRIHSIYEQICRRQTIVNRNPKERLSNYYMNAYRSVPSI